MFIDCEQLTNTWQHRPIFVFITLLYIFTNTCDVYIIYIYTHIRILYIHNLIHAYTNQLRFNRAKAIFSVTRITILYAFMSINGRKNYYWFIFYILARKPARTKSLSIFSGFPCARFMHNSCDVKGKAVRNYKYSLFVFPRKLMLTNSKQKWNAATEKKLLLFNFIEKLYFGIKLIQFCIIAVL